MAYGAADRMHLPAEATKSFIVNIPKAELHVHIEGTLEPGMMLTIARRNGAIHPERSLGEADAGYNFSGLQDFLDIYYKATAVLREERDFYDLARAYLAKAHSQGVRRAEIFFDPQAHVRRGVEFRTVIGGLHRALKEARAELGMSAALIMCFLRDMDVESMMRTLDEALPYRQWIVGVGLDSAEVGNPPRRFKKVFDRARSDGLLAVAHAGEEGPAEYIREALDILKVSRIDHGVHCLDDEKLVRELAGRRIPLTVCPLSNVKLKVVDRIEDHPLKAMMERGLVVTVNSDDPAYFGGYIGENYLAVERALGLTRDEICGLARNSVEASFLGDEEKSELLAELDDYVRGGGRPERLPKDAGRSGAH